MLYEQIIARVIGDSRERFAAEGADTAVLSELQKVRCAGEGILALADAGARARARAGAEARRVSRRVAWMGRGSERFQKRRRTCLLLSIQS